MEKDQQIRRNIVFIFQKKLSHGNQFFLTKKNHSKFLTEKKENLIVTSFLDYFQRIIVTSPEAVTS